LNTEWRMIDSLRGGNMSFCKLKFSDVHRLLSLTLSYVMASNDFEYIAAKLN